MGNANLSFQSKYRPKNLDECVGLGTQKDDIINMLLQKKKPSFIMLTGGSGLGKSTLERIIAKSIYCENFKKEKKPCEKCDSCIAFNNYIETGNSDNLPYVYDINGSKDNGKASMDTIIAESEYPAPMGEYKIFIVDEAHKLTDGAQNTILKPLEDEKRNIVYMMGTTDPQLLLSTIHSRVSFKIHLQKPTKDEVTELLQRICEGEKIQYHVKALELIADKGLETNGGVRACVNELNQIVVAKSDAKYDSVENYYMAMPTKIFFEYTSSLLHRRVEENITLIHHIKETVDLEVFIKELVTFIKHGIYVYNDIEVTSISRAELPKYKELFKKFSIQELSTALDSLRTIQQSNDIEADLMVLSFNGLLRSNTLSNDKEELTPIVEDVEKEIHNENIVRTKAIKKQETTRIEESKKKANEILMEEVSMADMMES